MLTLLTEGITNAAMDTKFFKSNLFKRYLLGFILVFIFPVVVLCTTYYFYFLPSYTEKIINIYEEQAYRSGTFVESMLTNIDNISQQLLMSKLGIGKYEITDPISANTETSRHLTSLSQSNECFEFIHLYNLTTDTIFTEKGTYKSKYYYHFRYGDEIIDLIELIQKTNGSAIWITEENICDATLGNNKAVCEMVYIRPWKTNNYILFSINLPYFQTMVENEFKPIILLNNIQIFPLNPVAETEMLNTRDLNTTGIEKIDGEYRLFYSSKLYDLLCVYNIPSNAIANSVHPLSRILIFALLLVSIIGGALVFYMTLASYRPIQNVRKLVVGAQNDVSNTYDDLEVIHQSFENLQNRILDNARQAEESRVLMKLFYSRNELTPSLREECARIGIELDSVCYYVLYTLHFAENLDDVLAESSVFVKSMTYTINNSQLVLIGVHAENMEEIPFILRSYIEQVPGGLFILSQPCNNAALLPNCYSEVIHTIAQIKEDDGPFIFCPQASAEGNEFIYPRSEIKALFHTISTGNIENSLLILDNLFTFFTDKTINEFYHFSIYADVINTGIHAFESVGQNDAADELRQHAIAYSKNILNPLSDSNVFSEIKEIFITHCVVAEKNSEKMMDIIDFIRQNRGNPHLNVSMVADAFGLSQSNLSHQFKTRFDLRISDYISQTQVEYACELLDSSDMSIADISSSLGFTQISSFIRKFKQETGLTPNQYRQREQTKHT